MRTELSQLFWNMQPLAHLLHPSKQFTSLDPKPFHISFAISCSAYPVPQAPPNYAIPKGWIPGIYTALAEVQQVIEDYPRCCWKTYGSIDDAGEAWLLYFGDGDRACGLRRLGNGDAPPPMEPEAHRATHLLALKGLQTKYHEARLDPLPQVLSGCDSLDILGPLYRVIQKTSNDGRPFYCHMVSIAPPRSSEPMVVSGRLTCGAEISHEDAAHICLRRLCDLLGAYVDDYNLGPLLSDAVFCKP
ncbi:hypothetical protein PIB30_087646 [Stylosanthes scabra]|uniref:Ribonuclease H1 N-terminal domain-containing protein n=1 Tax=Stylosanthes scabra TaxID=79078 RepID=A0ABU6ZS38_9FABA|nr:hypothetical protein [Stylosanthes scabra]